MENCQTKEKNVIKTISNNINVGNLSNSLEDYRRNEANIT